MFNFLPILMISSVSLDHSTVGRGVGDTFSGRDFQTSKATMNKLLSKNLYYTPAETHQKVLIVVFQL